MPTKNLARVEYNRLWYLYAIRKGYNNDIGKMIVRTFDTITQPFYSVGVGMVGIITQLCKMNGVQGHNTDVYMSCGRLVNLHTLDKFSRAPVAQPLVASGPREEDQEELPLEQPQQQHMPPLEIPRADPWIDQHLGHIVRQNEFLINAMMQQQLINAHCNNYHVGLAKDINTMAVGLNINGRVREPSHLPMFEARPPQSSFDEQWDKDEE